MKLLLFIPTYQLIMKQHIGSQSLSDVGFRSLTGCQHYLTHWYLFFEGKTSTGCFQVLITKLLGSLTNKCFVI